MEEDLGEENPSEECYIYRGFESGYLLCGLRQRERICTQILIDMEFFLRANDSLTSSKGQIYIQVLCCIGATTFELYLEVSFKVANGVEN